MIVELGESRPRLIVKAHELELGVKNILDDVICEGLKQE